MVFWFFVVFVFFLFLKDIEAKGNSYPDSDAETLAFPTHDHLVANQSVARPLLAKWTSELDKLDLTTFFRASVEDDAESCDQFAQSLCLFGLCNYFLAVIKEKSPL